MMAATSTLGCFLLVYVGFLHCLPNMVSAESKGHATTKPHGIVIDAGCAGSRLHIYSWEQRVYSTYPPPLNALGDQEIITALLSPGLADLSDSSDVSSHLAQLIEFAKASLKDNAKHYADIPIYFYATGNIRQLSFEKRKAIFNDVRDFLKDKELCPFLFREEFARVIGG